MNNFKPQAWFQGMSTPTWPILPAPKFQFNPLDQLKNLWVDIPSLNESVDIQIQERKAKTISLDEFHQKLDMLAQTPEAEWLTDAEIERYWFELVKDAGKFIQWVDLDKELAIEETEDKPEELWFLQNIASLGSSIFRWTWKEQLGQLWWDLKNLTLWAVTQIPEMWWDLGKFIVDNLANAPLIWNIPWLNLLSQSSDSLKVTTWYSLWDIVQAEWENIKQDLQNELWVNPEATSTQIWEFVTEASSLMVWPWKFNIPKDGLQKLSPKMKQFAEKFPTWFKVIENWLKWWTEWAKYWVISKWDVEVSDVALWAWVSTFLPLSKLALDKTLQWTSFLWEGIFKFAAQKIAWVTPEVANAIESNPELAKKLLTWKITEKQLATELNKLLPDTKIVDKEIKSILAWWKSTYQELIEKGTLSSDNVIDLAKKRWEELAEQRITQWTNVWKFRTSDVVTDSTSLTDIINTTAKSFNIKKTKSGLSGADSDIIRAYKVIQNEYDNIIGKTKNITADQLNRFHQAVKWKVNFTWWESQAFNNTLKDFSWNINDFTEKVLWDEYVIAKETLSKTFTEIDNFKALINKWDWTIKQNLRGIIANLKKPNNKDKLANIANAFWSDSQKFLKYLDDIEKWVTSDKALKVLSKEWSVQSLINSIKNSRDIDTVVKEEIIPKLDKLGIKENFAQLRAKITWEKYWGKQFNIQDLTESEIKAIAQIDTQLAESLQMLQVIKSLDKAVWQVWGLTLQQNVKLAVFRNPKIFANAIIWYNTTLTSTKALWDKIKNITSWGVKFTKQDIEVLNEVATKLMIYWNIEDDVYNWLTE